MFKLIVVVLLVAALMLGVGRYTSIGSQGAPTSVGLEELMRNPAAYDGKPVTVRGTVVSRISVLGAGGYRITGSGDTAVLVVGLNTAPQPGEQITVTGMFRVAAAVGPFQLPLIVAK